VAPLLSTVLVDQQLQTETKLLLMRALTKLTTDCKKHKQIAEKTQLVPYLAALIRDSPSEGELLPASTALLGNVIDYSSAFGQTYQALGLEELMLRTLSEEVKKDRYSELLLSCLQVLAFLAKNRQSALRIVKGKCGELLRPVGRLAMINNQNDVVGAEVLLLGRLFNEKEVKTEEVLEELLSGGLLEFMVEVAPVVPKIKQS
jgi:hypothetical protein